MSQELALFLPFPPAELNPNSKPFYGQTRRVQREYEEQVGWAIAAQRPRTWQAPERVRLNLAFFMCDRSVWDDDNCIAAFKVGRDQLTAAGIIADDDFRHAELGWVRVVHHRDARKRIVCPAWCPHEGVLVVVRAVADADGLHGDLNDYLARIRRNTPDVVPWKAA